MTLMPVWSAGLNNDQKTNIVLLFLPNPQGSLCTTLSDEGCHIKTIRSSQLFLSDNTTIFELITELC